MFSFLEEQIQLWDIDQANPKNVLNALIAKLVEVNGWDPQGSVQVTHTPVEEMEDEE